MSLEPDDVKSCRVSGHSRLELQHMLVSYLQVTEAVKASETPADTLKLLSGDFRRSRPAFISLNPPETNAAVSFIPSTSESRAFQIPPTFKSNLWSFLHLERFYEHSGGNR